MSALVALLSFQLSNLRTGLFKGRQKECLVYSKDVLVVPQMINIMYAPTEDIWVLTFTISGSEDTRVLTPTLSSSLTIPWVLTPLYLAH